ncbi:MAG: hypothetical protein QNK26_14825 [Moritella sp.]|uniref:hypothetical protein n=1 Tax=Moritella sp. TaxID=78556 RepID=UPI0029A5AACC|nr:hypothetical protein [Moritella sp.]MDX2321858.1 hypothetical protein [Moritella sp.]
MKKMMMVIVISGVLSACSSDPNRVGSYSGEYEENSYLLPEERLNPYSEHYRQMQYEDEYEASYNYKDEYDYEYEDSFNEFHY